MIITVVQNQINCMEYSYTMNQLKKYHTQITLSGNLFQKS